MEVYLAGESPVKNGAYTKSWQGLNILESYYYVRKNKHFPRLYGTQQNFLLDSGAFTFMQNNDKKLDFDAYVEEYAEFVKKWDIKHFFELDVDSVVGLKEVERLRAKLETLAGRQCVPVWHTERGKQYFLDMVKEYPYVALGSIAKVLPPKIQITEKYFPWFIKTAHENKAKIHALGYTSLEGLKRHHFDSVDSTAWIYGNLGGHVYKFNPNTGIVETIHKPQGTRMKNRETLTWNLNEWIKYLNYARKEL